MLTFQRLSGWDVDLIPNLVASAMPLALYTLFVVAFVNGRAPSYFIDLWLWQRRRAWVALYAWGLRSQGREFVLSRPAPPIHPLELCNRKGDQP
jgi:hypothetical protein